MYFLFPEDPDAGEYPKIEFKYHVEFLFMKDVTLPEQNEDIVMKINDKEVPEDTVTTASKDECT